MKVKRNQVPDSVWGNPVHFLAFGLGTGASPYAPGTVGTLLGIPLVYMLSDLPLWLYLMITAIFIATGIWLCDKTSKDIGVHDHSGIVIDEVAGYLVTMIALPVNLWTLALAFLVFRFFDIIKPWPIGVIDRTLKGGMGIMVDDLLAGVYSWLVMVAGIWIYTSHIQ